MEPAEDGQDRIVERLHPQAHAIDAGGPIGDELVARDAFRVALDGDLDVRGDGKAVTGRIEDPRDLVGLEQRGRATTEEHRRDLWPPSVQRRRSEQLDLGDGAPDVTLHARPILERRRIEGAVVAPLPAERHVNIKPQLSTRRQRIRQRPVW